MKSLPLILKITIVCCSLLFLIGCTNKKSKGSVVNEVKPYPHTINMSEGLKNISQLKLSDIADSIKYIVLSKDKQVLIGNITDIQMSENNFYLQSDYQVMRFDLSGRFLNSFGNIGRGPEEYLMASLYSLTPDYDKVLILRSMLHDYLIYTPDGDSVGTRELPVSERRWDFVSMSDSTFFLTFLFVGRIMNEEMFNSIPGLAGLFDFEGKPINVLENPLKNSELSDVELKMAVLSNPSFTFFENRIVVSPEGDTIYEVDKKSISPGFIINWGQIAHQKGVEELFFSQEETFNKVINFMPLIETPTKAYFKGRNLNDYYVMEYDKVTGNSKSMTGEIDNLGLINDLDGGTNYFPNYANREGDVWIMEEDAISFKEKHTEEFLSTSPALYPGMKDNLKVFLDSLKQDDNPVLKIVYLKKFMD